VPLVGSAQVRIAGDLVQVRDESQRPKQGVESEAERERKEIVTTAANAHKALVNVRICIYKFQTSSAETVGPFLLSSPRISSFSCTACLLRGVKRKR
jgi:hypothetical protein